MIFNSVLSPNRGRPAASGRRLVVTAPNWLGDAVMSLPLVGLLSALEGVTVTVLAPPYTARIYGGLDGVDELIVCPRQGRSRALGWQRRMLRRLQPAGIILTPPSFSSALPAFLAGVRRRIGYRTDGRGFMLTDPLPPRDLRNEHVSENYIRLGRAAAGRLGLSVPEHVTVPRLKIQPAESDQLDQLLAEAGAPRNGFFLVCPGAAYGNAKAWPADACRRAITKLAESGPVVLAGGPADREATRRLADGLGGVYDLAGRTSLGQFLALIDRARVLLANDSGAPHAAGSLGTPAVVIFGSTSPVWTTPLGESVQVVRQPILCSPCFLRKCPTRLECFEHIQPAEVAGRVLELAKKEVDISTGRR